MKVKGHWINAPQEVIETLKEKFDLQEKKMSINFGEEPCVLLCEGTGVLSTRISPENLFKRHEGVLEYIQNVLHDLSYYTGISFRLDFASGPGFIPEEATERELNIVVGASAPGEYRFYRSTHICGVMLDAAGYQVTRPAPSLGRGFVVKDDDGYDVVQIVGRTIYLLIPTTKLSSLHTLGRESGDLFLHALRLGWNAYVEGGEVNSPPIIDEEGYKGALAGIGNSISVATLLRLKTIDELLEETLARYRELLSEKREKTALVSATMRTCVDRVGRYSEDWKRIQERPEVDSVYLVDGGINIRTKHIVSEEWEGNQHNYGVYHIRFGEHGRVSVWCENPCIRHAYRIRIYLKMADAVSEMWGRSSTRQHSSRVSLMPMTWSSIG